MADSYYLFYLLYVVVAQLAEHLTFNQAVEGSNPSHHTIIRSLSSDGLEQWPSKPQVASSILAVTTIIQGCSLSGKRIGLINRRQLVQIQSSLPYFRNIAQLVEQRSPKPQVVSSSLTVSAIFQGISQVDLRHRTLTPASLV